MGLDHRIGGGAGPAEALLAKGGQAGGGVGLLLPQDEHEAVFAFENFGWSHGLSPYPCRNLAV